MKLPRFGLLLLVAFVWCHSALAHSMYQSAVLLDFHADSVSASVELPASRLGQAFGKTLDWGSLPKERTALEAYILQRFRVTTDSKPWSVVFQQPLRWSVVDGAPYVIADVICRPPEGRSARRFELEDDVITDTLVSHTVLVSVRSDWNSSTFANDPELLGILNGSERSMHIDRQTGDWTRGFRSVFLLGTRHIAEGTDHLLFLLALLLPAPLLRVGHRWSSFAGIRHGVTKILQVVTAFTVGHSVTLALAAFGLVHVPANPIEVLIAGSILVSAVHALRPIFPGREALIAGAFGLIHGLAFASTLAELGLHRWERVESILAFNLGIEAMQLLVVLCIMPSLMLLSQTSAYTTFRVVGGMFAAVAALGWIVERSTHIDLRVDRVVDALARHASIVATVLFIGSLLAFVRTRTRPMITRA